MFRTTLAASCFLFAGCLAEESAPDDGFETASVPEIEEPTTFVHAFDHQFVDEDETLSFEVPAGAQALVIDGGFFGPAPTNLVPQACVTPGATIEVLDPAGEVAAKSMIAGASAQGPQAYCGPPIERTIDLPAAGVWTVAFTGDGAIRALVIIEGE